MSSEPGLWGTRMACFQHGQRKRVPMLGVTLPLWCDVANQAVPQHVNCVYVLYALERTDPSAPRELICHFSLSRARCLVSSLVKVSVFADGTYEIGALHSQPARENPYSHYHSLQQQQGGDEVAAGGPFAAGTGLTSSAEQHPPPAAGADTKALLLPDSAVWLYSYCSWHCSGLHRRCISVGHRAACMVCVCACNKGAWREWAWAGAALPWYTH